MRKFTDKEIKKLKVFWKKLQDLEEEFDYEVRVLEELMQKAVDIEDLEFFKSDDGYCGIGNTSRTIKLIQYDKLEEKWNIYYNYLLMNYVILI